MWRLKEFRITHILFTIPFLVMGFLINFVQLVMSILLPRHLFHQLNYYTVCGIYGFLVALADWWGHTRLTIYCSQQFNTKIEERSWDNRALVIVNHHTELDWLVCWQFADRAKNLGGCRALAKKSLQYVPIIGWSSFLSGDVFLSRSWEKDKLLVEAKVKALDDQPTPNWLFVFPEGTRFNPAKHKASLEFAASRGLPRLEHHLIPRTKGFSATAAHMEGTLIDLTIVQGEGAPPTLTSLLMGKEVDTRIFVREISLSEVPKDEKESGEWLMELFRQKDLIKSAYLSGDWSLLSSLGSFTARPSPPRPWSIIYAAGCNVLVLGLLLLALITKGGPTTWVAALLFLGVVWAALHQLVNVSKIKKSE